jgi:hypothetical protein
MTCPRRESKRVLSSVQDYSLDAART